MPTHKASSEIQPILERQMNAWAEGDAVSFSSTFAEDAVFVTVRGDLVQGRRGIEANHAFIFNGPYKNTTLKETVELIVPLGPSVLVAHIAVELSGVAAFPPGITPSEPGILRTRFIFVLTQSEGNWQIRSAQNTIVVPQPLRN